jgi:hypothetical protein
VRAAALLLAIALPAQAQMYKCVDERGVTRYTDEAGARCKPVDIRGSPPISGGVQPPGGGDLPRQDADFKRRQLEREKAAAREKQALTERCARLRAERGTLSTGRRLARINDKGERVYLEDADRDRRVAELQRELAACP